MSVINKRNAILGWAVWTVGKAGAKRKAKQSVQPSDNRKAKGAAVLSGVAAAGSAVWFWRRRRSEDES